jgi:diacylglycerol kinase (ATP)
MNPTLVIYNPVAGRGRVHEHWAEVQQALHTGGVAFDSVATEAPLHAVKLAREAASRYERVVCVGGDGTLHEIVNGLMQASGEGETVTLGIIPLGNGDDFVKNIPPLTPVGGKPFDWSVAVQKVITGQPQLFDVGRIVSDRMRPGLPAGPYYYVNSMDVGFGARGAYIYTTLPKFIKGLTAYYVSALATLLSYPTLHLSLKMDDQPPLEAAANIAALMNGRCFANGFWLSPEASADDGLLDVVIVRKVGRPAVIKILGQLPKGTHLTNPNVKVYRAQRVMVDSREPLLVETDGEIPILDARHLEVEILQKRLRVMV